MSRNLKWLAGGLVALGMLWSGAGSAAAIVCEGPYQVVGGNSISTPYCQDSYLAKVARSYGVRVSDAEVRENPGTKIRLCRFIGYDNRLSGICAGEIMHRPPFN
jgi:hypothetical protein